jgi:tetratricopeptide (TPR) repeat protein
MKKLFLAFSALLGLTGAIHSAEPISIQNAGDHDRVYKAACDIIEPYMRLHGKPEKKVTPAAVTEIKRAIGMLDAVTTYAPTNWAAFWIKGKAYQAVDDRKAACAEFKSAFDLQDKNPDVAREYMFECLNLGDGAEGLRAAQHAVSLNPSDAGLHANLALALIIAAKPKEALAAIDESLRIDPKDQISQNVRKVVLKIIDGTKPQPRTLGELGK